MVYNSIYNHPHTKNLRKQLRRNQTDAEKKLWDVLRGKKIGFKFFRQYSIGNYILDFYCPAKRLAIEADGGQHAEEKSLIYDMQRTLFLNEKNIKVLRFGNNSIISNLEGVYQKIIDELNSSLPPLASRGGA